MKSVKARNALSLTCNTLNPVLVVIAISFFYTGNSEEIFGISGAECYRFFTIDSNILAAASCLALIPFNVKALKSGKNEIPRWAAKFKYVGADAVALTMLVVLCYLMPVQGVEPMTVGGNLYLHLICPPLVIFSYLFLEKGKVGKKDAFLGVSAVLAYAAVYLTKVVAIGEANGGWPDFYNFNDNNTWPYFFTGIMVFTYAISRLMCFAKSKIEG